jgi:hypothetical protein
VTKHSDDAITKLYAVPLDAFTRERNTLAAALAKAGQTDRARAVRQLRRPSAPLWATNQLARVDSERLEAFLDSVVQIRKTQLRDPRAATEALTRQRRELQHLVRQAGELLAKHGARATPEAERRISDMLLGAAVDRDRADELRHGRLTQELAAPGFEVLAGTGRPGHLRLVRGGQPARTRDTPPETAEPENVERCAGLDREGQRQRDEAARSLDKAARQREEKRRQQEEAALVLAAHEPPPRGAASGRTSNRRGQAGQEAKELTARLAAARQRLAEARRAAKLASTGSRASRLLAPLAGSQLPRARLTIRSRRRSLRLRRASRPARSAF